MKKTKKTVKKAAHPKPAYLAYFISITAVVSVILIAVAFVLGSYYLAHPEIHVLGASTH